MIDSTFIQYPYAPRERKHTAPAVGIFDSPYACLRINQEWAGHLIGVLGILLEADSWLGDETEIFRIQQEIHRLFRAFKDDSGCDDCDGDDPEDAALEMRVTPECVLQYSTDDGLNWLTVPGWAEYALACFVGPQGEQGDTGEQGVPGEQGEQGPPGEDCACEPGNPPPDPPDPDDPDADGKLCGIAVSILDFMKNTNDDWLDDIAVGTEILDVISQFTSVLIVGFPIVGVIMSVFDAIVSIGSAYYASVIDNSFIEVAKCEMYCELKLQGGWSSAIWEPWKERIRNNDIYVVPTSSAPIELFMGFSGIVDDNEWNARASIGQHSPDSFCELCECCETGDTISVEWTAIGSTPPAWTTLGTIDSSAWAGDTTDIIDGDYSGATRGSNADWQKSTLPNNAPPNDNTKIGIKYVFDEPTGVSHIKWTLKANGSNTKIMHVAVMLEDDTMLVVDAFKDPLPTPTEITRDETFDCVMAKEVWFLGVTGAHGLSQLMYISQTTEIN